MATGGNVEIVIRKSQTGQGTDPTQITGEQTVSTDKDPGKPSATQGAINTAIINAGRQTIMSGVKHYGALTGNYNAQKQINNALGIGADILMIAKGGPIGVIAVASRHALSAADSFVQQRIADRENDLARQRVGNISHRGSRYNG